ncbi:MAG: DUF4835 family protein [Cyclobacteriaceae bacterium]|nr:DUF4835 family protein [Cyclobacteriaceae bacterium]
MKLLKDYSLVFVLLFLLIYKGHGQELNCTVIVNSEKVRSTDRSVFDDMETSFEQFLNTRRWTNDQFKVHERIECNLNIIIEDAPRIGSYSASIQIQAARPVYGSNYESIILNFADRDWQFEYIESQPLDFSENAINSNLTSMLAFYTYLILGLDYDSFSDLGGTTYFQKAYTVVNNAQQINRPGWKSNENNMRNRYWLIENLTNKRMEPIRKGYYTYHRLAMDTYYEDQDASRQKILKVLQDVKTIKDQSPASVLVIAFIDAKTNELINIYSDGSMQVRQQAFTLLSQINPSRRDEFSRILN